MDTQEMGVQRGEIICQGYPVSSNSWTRVHVFFSFFFCDLPLILIYLFYWSINALQRWVDFCCTTMWISSLSLSLSTHTYTHTHTHTHTHPSLLSIPRTSPPHATPWSQHRAPSWGPCATQQLPTSYLFHTWWCIHANPNVPSHPTLSAPSVSTSLISMSVPLFLPCK